jgi:hypothetical protein
MTERHLIAYAILFLAAAIVFAVWRLGRRAHGSPDPHLRIDLVKDDRA